MTKQGIAISACVLSLLLALCLAAGTASGKATVRGYVKDIKTGPIYNATVSAYNTDFNITSTDENGYYEMDLPPGDYLLQAWADGYYPGEYDLNLTNGSVVRKDFELIPYQRDTYLMGYIRDNETDMPVFGATIIAHDPYLGEVNMSVTNESGYYFIGLIHGEVNLMINASNYQVVNVTLNLSAGDHWLNLTMQSTLETTSAIRGYVRDLEGSPLYGITVSAYNIEGDHALTSTDKNGYYYLDMRSGFVIFGTSGEGYYPVTRMMWLEENTTAWYNFSLQHWQEPNASVFGTVTDDEGRPLSNITVTLFNPWLLMYGEYTGFTDVTDERGDYHIDAPNGTFYLMALGPTYDLKDWYYYYAAVLNVTISGETRRDITLKRYDMHKYVDVEFDDWDHIKVAYGFSTMSFFSLSSLSRVDADMFMGNGDGIVSASEASAFEHLVEKVMPMYDMEEDNTTEDKFYVDDTYYVLTTGWLEDIEISGIEGPITDVSPMRIVSYTNATSHHPISEIDNHILKVNISLSSKQNLSIVLPPGFVLKDYYCEGEISGCPVGLNVTGFARITITFSGTDNRSVWVIMNVTRMDLPPAVNLNDPVEIGVDSMTLTWTTYAGADFDAYVVYMSTDSDRLGTAVATIKDINTTTYRPTGLMPNTTYYFVVRVYDDYGLYNDSNQVSGTTRTTGEIYDITLSVTVSDKKPREGDRVRITAQITNVGTMDIHVIVTFAVDGKLMHTQSMIVPVGSTNVTSYQWKSEKGEHTITVNATFNGGYHAESINVNVEKKREGIPGFEPIIIGTSVALAIFLLRRRRR